MSPIRKGLSRKVRPARYCRSPRRSSGGRRGSSFSAPSTHSRLQRNCHRCHGEKPEGPTVNAQVSSPAPVFPGQDVYTSLRTKPAGQPDAQAAQSADRSKASRARGCASSAATRSPSTVGLEPLARRGIGLATHRIELTVVGDQFDPALRNRANSARPASVRLQYEAAPVL